MVKSAIIPLQDCVVDPGDGNGHDCFEPGAIANRLPKEFHSVQKSLTVLISDGSVSATYDFEVFLGKTYPVKNGKVRFGSKVFFIGSLSVTIGLAYKIEDLSDIMDLACD